MKTNKNLENINRRIKRNAAIFKKATKAQKRVMIAKDVLAQIKDKRYSALQNSWVVARYKYGFMPDNESGVQELFAHKKIKHCKVCALGGLFMSCINLNNSTTHADFSVESENIGKMIWKNEKFSNGLDKFFTKLQLRLIEFYFECGEGFFSAPNLCVHYDRAELFYNKYPNHKNRLKAIMKNIIKNNGTFVPKELNVG